MGEMERRSLAWWRKAQDIHERARLAVECQKLIAQLPSETYRRDKDLQNVRLYENNPVITLYNFAGNYYQEATMALPTIEQSTNNRAKSAIDTFASQVFSTNQRARFRTVDAKHRQRRRSREMQNFTDGLTHELKLHRLRQRAGMDAAILESGIGGIQFYRQNDRCAAERVLATEFSFDPDDGLINGEPQTLYRRRALPRDKVHALFGDPDEKSDTYAAIELAKPINTSGVPSDRIEVFEQWHLPTEEGADDGWHVIGIDVAERGGLVAEEYTKPFHEVVFFAIEGRFTTGLGLSLMTQARKLQYRINANEYRVERARKLCHSGHLYVNQNNKIKKSTLTNEIGTVWEGMSDTPPQQIVFQQVAAEWEAAIERDGQRIFENLGINLHASQAQTNTGLDSSGAAKREEKATSDERSSVRQQRWEQFHLDCVKVALSVVRDCVEKTETGGKRKERIGYKVASPGKRGLTVTDWKEAAMDEADYVMEIEAASPIPTDPAGLMAFGREMVDLGAWKPSQLAGYMQDLDAEGRVNRQMAQERQLEKTFEALLYDKVAVAMPDEFTNYALALDIGTEYLAQGMEDDVPEKNLERVRRYLKKCKALAAAAMAAAAPPPGAAPGGPPGAPPAGEAPPEAAPIAA